MVKDLSKKGAFLDGDVGIARYDRQRYAMFEKLTERQLGYFWRPQEVDITRDASDFKNLSPQGQHIFTSNLKRQILLDTVQGRSPSLAFLPLASLPEIEVWIQTWTFFETIHSRSYTHIIRNVYPNPGKVFDTIMDIPEIAECATAINGPYDELEEVVRHPGAFSDYEQKRRLWNCIVAVNVLEGIRFYVSFACSWAFAEQKTMEGNAKIIKLIARDENLHLAGTQHLIKILQKEDETYAQIAKDCYEENRQMFIDAAEQEKRWAAYLFKDGSILGLTERMVCDYINWLTAKRMKAAGYEPIEAPAENPLPFTERWIAGENVQVAPQETEISSYTIGQIKQDVKKDTFAGFSL